MAPLRAVQDEEEVTGRVFIPTEFTPPPYVQSLQHRQHMTMQARAVAMRFTDGELLFVSAAESLSRTYERLSQLSEVHPEMAAAYVRFLNQYEYQLHRQLSFPVHY